MFQPHNDSDEAQTAEFGSVKLIKDVNSKRSPVKLRRLFTNDTVTYQPAVKPQPHIDSQDSEELFDFSAPGTLGGRPVMTYSERLL